MSLRKDGRCTGAEEIAEGVLRHLDPPRREYPSRAAAAIAALDSTEDNSEPDSAEPSTAEIFAAACARLLALRELIAELRELNRPLRRPDPSRPQQIIDAAAELLGLAEKASDAEAREWKEKERAAAFSRKVTSCKSCPFSDGVAGEWCRRYSRFNPPHELEAWGRPEWCEPGDIVVTIEETEVEDDKGDQRVNYTSGEKK